MGDPFDLSGRIALVTGASQGLGRRFATVLAEHGAAVALAARQLDKLRDWSARSRSAAAGSRASRSTSPTRAASRAPSTRSRMSSARSTC